MEMTGLRERGCSVGGGKGERSGGERSEGEVGHLLRNEC